MKGFFFLNQRGVPPALNTSHRNVLDRAKLLLQVSVKKALENDTKQQPRADNLKARRTEAFWVTESLQH